jgi:hypothetical protein
VRRNKDGAIPSVYVMQYIVLVRPAKAKSGRSYTCIHLPISMVLVIDTERPCAIHTHSDACCMPTLSE